MLVSIEKVMEFWHKQGEPQRGDFVLTNNGNTWKEYVPGEANTAMPMKKGVYLGDMLVACVSLRERSE